MEYNCSPTVGMERWQGRKSDAAQPLAATERGQSESSYCARIPPAPSICLPASCLPQSVGGIAKQEFKRRYKRMHANHADGVGLRLCQLPIKRVTHGVSAAPDHLRALRASAYICVESFLVPRCHRSLRRGPAISDRQSQHHRSRRVGEQLRRNSSLLVSSPQSSARNQSSIALPSSRGYACDRSAISRYVTRAPAAVSARCAVRAIDTGNIQSSAPCTR